MRNTVQRALVLEAVRELHCHATADEVYNAVLHKYPDISRGTVYRNLNLLADIGEISRLEMRGTADRYDHLCNEHYHARCLKCGQIIDVDMEFIAGLENNVKDARGFQFTGHDVIFKGICPDCSAKEQGGR